MGIEQKVNYQLNHFPALKKAVKRIYQTGMYVVSPKISSEGNIIRISPADENHEYFFGYYDKSPWDATDRYMLCMRAEDTWSDVSPHEKADILMIDTKKAEDDPERVRKVAKTRAWNVQQSCMLQWLGPDFSRRILYNDFRDGKYCAVILTLDTMEEKIVPAPVYTVAADGRTALTLDFSRLYNLRPGYGYYNVPESTKGEALPDKTAIWRINLESKEVTDLLKYTDFAAFLPRPEMREKGSVHKVNHIMLSPNGKRFMVLYRWFNGQRKYTRLITCNVDGTDMYVLSDDNMVSHCCWKNNSEILAFENKKKAGPGYYLMKDKTQKYIHCWPQLSGDGHPSYSPNGSLIVTDSYPDRARVASIKIMNGNERDRKCTTIARVFAPFKYDNDTRCDLHPRWNRKGDRICFDAVFEGHRGLYVVKVPDEHKMDADTMPEGLVRDNDSPRISVIIPVYNAETYLERCVSSVMKQTYTNLEIILVDDGSTDRSGELCDAIAQRDSRICVLHKQNGGLSSARNAGLEIASGAYIAFVDSDDWIEVDTYSYTMKLIQKYNADIADIECQYAYSDHDPVKEVQENLSVYKEKDVLWNYFDRGLTLQNNAPYTVWRKLYRNDVIGETRFSNGKNSEDLLFNYIVLKKTQKIVLSNVIKYHYFQNNTGISKGKLKRADLALLDICKEICNRENNTAYKCINKLTKVKLARSYFSLLARVATSGYKKAEFEDMKAVIKMLTKGLRKNFFLLMSSSIPKNRKLFICIFCINYRLVAYPYRMLKRLRGSKS